MSPLRTHQVGTSSGRAPTRIAALIAVIGALIMSSGLILLTSSSASATQDVVHKSYVCKYVKKPGGGTELLQTGQNPIWVDNHSIAGKDIVSVGDKFADAQGYSQVIVANTVKLDPEPGISECPQTSTPPGDNLCPEGTDHAGQVIPEGETASSFCDDEEQPPPVCAEGTDHAGQVIPEGETASSFCDDGQQPPPVCAEGTDHAGQVIPNGETAATFCDDDTTTTPTDKCPALAGNQDSTSHCTTVKGAEASRPKPGAMAAPRGAEVLSTEAAVPTVVDAGLVGTVATTGTSTRMLVGQGLLGGGLVLLIGAALLGLGRREHGAVDA